MPKSPDPDNRHRIQFDLSDRGYAKLARLVEIDQESAAAIWRDALELYYYFKADLHPDDLVTITDHATGQEIVRINAKMI